MHIYVDADACPVIGIVERIAKSHNIAVTLLCDTNHYLTSDYSEVVYVGAGADAVDFKEIENLYWDLIDKSKEEPSFPDWEKGVHPSADFLMAGIVKKELFVLRDEGIIKACAIVNSNSNKEYKKVAWKVNERDNNVWIIHALAVRYEYRGMGLATQFVKNLISYAKLENIEAIHLDVIDKNTLADKLYIRAGFKYVSTENIFYEVVGNRQFRMYEYVIE